MLMFPQYWLVEVAVYVKRWPGDCWSFYCYDHSWAISPAKAAGATLSFPKPPALIEIGDLVQVATFDGTDPWGEVVEVEAAGLDVRVPGWAHRAYFSWKGILAHKKAEK